MTRPTRPASLAFRIVSPTLVALTIAAAWPCAPAALGQDAAPGAETFSRFPDVPPPRDADARLAEMVPILGWVALCMAALAALVGLAVLSARLTDRTPGGSRGPVPITNRASGRRDGAVAAARESR